MDLIAVNLGQQFQFGWVIYYSKFEPGTQCFGGTIKKERIQCIFSWAKLTLHECISCGWTN